MHDWELLAAYAADNNPNAFHQLVARHRDWVYSVCLRHLRDTALAEDATQALFLAVAQQARTLSARGTALKLEPWLHRAAKFAAANLRRAERRRKSHEAEAAAMKRESHHPADPWLELQPHLEPALDLLPLKDRHIILLRFYRRLTYAQIASALSITEAAATKRVNRALARLRDVFAKRGITTAHLAIGPILLTHAVHPAPPAIATATAASPHSASLAKSILRLMRLAKTKSIALVTLPLLTVLAAATPLILSQSFQLNTIASAASPPLIAPASPSAATTPARGPDHFSEDLQQALGIKDTAAEIIPFITAAIATQTTPSTRQAVPPPISDAPINELADALLKGPHPSVLIDQLIPAIEIRSPADNTLDQNPAWKSFTASLRLSELLWQLAAKQPDPQRASQLARASLMLAALNDYKNGWESVAVIVNDPATAKKLLAMTDAEFSRLKSVVNARAERSVIANQETLEAYKRIDTVTLLKATPITTDAVQSILWHLDRAFRNGPEQLGCRFQIITNTWSFLNLLKLRHADEGETLVRDQLQLWQKDFPDPTLDRWLTQALTREGPPPRKLGSV